MGKGDIRTIWLKCNGGAYPFNFKPKRNPLKVKPTPTGDIRLALKDKLLLKLEEVEKASTKGLYFMDSLLKSVSSRSINTSKLTLFLTAHKGNKGKDKRLPFKSLFASKSIAKGAIAKGRLLFQLTEPHLKTYLFTWAMRAGHLIGTVLPKFDFDKKKIYIHIFVIKLIRIPSSALHRLVRIVPPSENEVKNLDNTFDDAIRRLR